MSSSASPGRSHASATPQHRVHSAASSAAAGRLRQAASSRETRCARAGRAPARAFSGGRATARSLRTSTASPPPPSRSPGRTPDRGQAHDQLARAGRWAIACTVKPRTRRIRPHARHALQHAIAAARAPRALPRSRPTPPTSDLCRICGETIFSATGKPIAAAADTASSASAPPGARRSRECRRRAAAPSLLRLVQPFAAPRRAAAISACAAARSGARPAAWPAVPAAPPGCAHGSPAAARPRPPRSGVS